MSGSMGDFSPRLPPKSRKIARLSLLGFVLLVSGCWYATGGDTIIATRLLRHTAYRAIRDAHSDHTVVSASQLFGTDLAAVCFFHGGYRPRETVRGGERFKAALAAIAQSHLRANDPSQQTWTIYAVSRRGIGFYELPFKDGNLALQDDLERSVCLAPRARLVLTGNELNSVIAVGEENPGE